MFCSNCGIKLDDDAKFCRSCGQQTSVEKNTTIITTGIKFVLAKCATCGANVKVNSDNEIMTCPFCGNKYFVEKDNNITGGTERDNPLQKDSLFAEAGKIIVEKQKGSTALIQRTLQIDYERAKTLMDQLEHEGVVGPQNGVQRKVLMSMKEYAVFLKKNNY